jgi:hypothetical protein
MTLKYLLCAAVPALLLANDISMAAEPQSPAIHKSPNHIEERCVILEHIPGGEYSDKDAKAEAALCGIDLYASSITLCPATWTGSPATMLYQLTAGPYKESPQKFEETVCSRGEQAVGYTAGSPYRMDHTLIFEHGDDSSAAAALLYYHFSRYFDTHIRVPVAVQRSMDNAVHRSRVTQRGVDQTSQGDPLLHSAWLELLKAQSETELPENPGTLSPADQGQLSSALLQPTGSRCSVLINGIATPGDAAEAYAALSQTPASQALQSAQPLQEAIAAGLELALQQPQFVEAGAAEVSPRQMVYWMQDLSEILLLDYIFSQQRRIGNIDCLDYWYWKKGRNIRKQLARTRTPPKNMARHKPLRIQDTVVNNNSSAVLLSCRNFTREAGMLQKLAHFNPDTYKRLIRLDKDFSREDKLYRYLQQNFGLGEEQLQQIVSNTREAAEILKGSCKQKKLRFDLDPNTFFVRGNSRAKRINCDNP